MLNKRKTKIIATLGPASANAETIKKFVEYGVDIIRINFSHGNYETYTKQIDLIRSVKSDMPVMADLKGAEIRTIVKDPEGLLLKEECDVELMFNPDAINDSNFSLNYANIAEISKKNNHIMADDGNIDFIIKEVKQDRLVVTALCNAVLKDRKGVHFIDVDVPFPILSGTDKKDIEFALSHNIDFFAASMIRSEKEIYAIRGIVPENIPIVAKIEHPLAIQNIDKILDAADMILVARGDLGVELPITQVPMAQKHIVNAARRRGKPVIIATQLLDSMMNNPRPTRAEVSDIANSVYDMTDALMLTGETAAGKYPAGAIKYLVETVDNAEKNIDYKSNRRLTIDKGDSSDAISFAAIDAAYSLNTKAIVCFTATGATALRLSKFRPQMPIIALTPDVHVVKRLNSAFGITSIKIPLYKNSDEMIDNVKTILLENRFLNKGDVICITAGIPIGVSGTTNMLRIIEIDR